MKNSIIYLLLLLSAIGFTACNEKPTQTTSEPVVEVPKRMKILSYENHPFYNGTGVAVFEDTVTHRQYICVETYHGVALQEIK